MSSQATGSERVVEYVLDGAGQEPQRLGEPARAESQALLQVLP
ncbi:hypothetical protein [Nonomuraea basaltis]|nr:hypothetical protein [Nonomuraea basaltis]